MNVHDNPEFKRLGQMLGAAKVEAEREKLRAARASALANAFQATLKESQPQSPNNRAESPIYREPTLEDAKELLQATVSFTASFQLEALKQLGFVRKVQP